MKKHYIRLGPLAFCIIALFCTLCNATVSIEYDLSNGGNPPSDEETKKDAALMEKAADELTASYDSNVWWWEEDPHWEKYVELIKELKLRGYTLKENPVKDGYDPTMHLLHTGSRSPHMSFIWKRPGTQTQSSQQQVQSGTGTPQSGTGTPGTSETEMTGTPSQEQQPSVSLRPIMTQVETPGLNPPPSGQQTSVSGNIATGQDGASTSTTQTGVGDDEARNMMNNAAQSKYTYENYDNLNVEKPGNLYGERYPREYFLDQYNKAVAWLASHGYRTDGTLYYDASGGPYLKFKEDGTSQTKPGTQTQSSQQQPSVSLKPIMTQVETPGLNPPPSEQQASDGSNLVITYEVTNVNNQSGANLFHYSQVENTWPQNWWSQSKSSGSSGSSSCIGGSGTLITNWTTVGVYNTASLTFGSLCILMGGSSSEAGLAFAYVTGQTTYAAKPQNGCQWENTSSLSARTYTLGTTNTDKVRIGGTVYTVTHQATSSGVTVTSITR